MIVCLLVYLVATFIKCARTQTLTHIYVLCKCIQTKQKQQQCWKRTKSDARDDRNCTRINTGMNMYKIGIRYIKHEQDYVLENDGFPHVPIQCKRSNKKNIEKTFYNVRKKWLLLKTHLEVGMNRRNSCRMVRWWSVSVCVFIIICISGCKLCSLPVILNYWKKFLFLQILIKSLTNILKVRMHKARNSTIKLRTRQFGNIDCGNTGNLASFIVMRTFGLN